MATKSKPESAQPEVTFVTPAPAQPHKHVSIRDNPYLSDEDKQMLIDTNIRKLTQSPVPHNGQAPTRVTALLVFANSDGTVSKATANVYATELKAAWAFYKENFTDANGKEFLAKYANNLASNVTVLSSEEIALR